MNNLKNDLSYWQEKHNNISTKIGKWIGGEDVKVREYSLFNDLFGKISYMQMVVLNITGRLISKELSTWLENNFICMSYPDARIWCNQVGALAGANHTSPTAATVAGVLSADSRAYGGSQTTKIAMEYIQNTLIIYKEKLRIAGKDNDDSIIEEIINSAPIKHNKPAIVGFVRPVDKQDERIQPHINMSKSLGFEIGEHMKLANKVSTYLLKHYNSGINIGGYTAAFLSDQGVTPEEGYQIKHACVSSGVTACYIDNLQHNNNEFLPLKCSDVEYTGKEIREL
jgi:citrate synthase